MPNQALSISPSTEQHEPVQQSVSISAIVTTLNSADLIEDCLNSLRWADELIVVDSGSTDRTCELAESIGARVLHHPYEDPVAQKLWSISQAAGQWILWIDSDERLHEDLRHEILENIVSTPSHAGYRIPRLNYVFGKPVRFADYYPDWQTRLFRREKWYIDPGTQIHEHIQLKGTCGTLKCPIHHLAHRTVDQTTATLLIRWTTFEARQRYSRGVRFSLWQLVARTVGAFGLRYFLHQGYRDGLRGVFVSGYWAAYLFIVYFKLWEIEHSAEAAKASHA